MTRPMALIEGDLTIPLPRPYDGLPPPFGIRRRVMREAVHQAVRETAAPAQLDRFPPGVQHVLFYKAPPQRVDTGRWDAALAEAKRYLEMNTARPRSSRSDHLLAGAIFAGCTIALTWLLVTCSMKEAEKAKAVPLAPAVLSAVSPHVDSPKPVAKPAVADTQTAVAVEKTSPPAASAVTNVAAKPADADAPLAASISQLAQTGPLPSLVPKQVGHVAALSPAEPKQTAQVLPRQTVQVSAHEDDTATSPTTPPKRVKVARLSETHVKERVALNRATRPVTQPAVSKQPEWTAGTSHSHSGASTDNAPWLNWSAQQLRPAPTIRQAAPVPGDSSWNDHMTQRRITDDPTAFHVGGSGQ
ncbi:hypothetical protein [Paraburkholderia phenazinium]|jgi:hypothetical protein|uniref:Uncharacterized protein n=1 Tax=Paraburkholderia phenazinium TaxID=60549 RepID=A0A1G7QKQ6_9BURK|nr:hypothetical protein [Paraburkholderia phenazinium]SDF98210.1 hypothetical protein SAMN05216466_101775 [Paraburkholderia phenazinium]